MERYVGENRCDRVRSRLTSARFSRRIAPRSFARMRRRSPSTLLIPCTSRATVVTCERPPCQRSRVAEDYRSAPWICIGQSISGRRRQPARTDALSPRLVQARLSWALRDRGGRPLYEFDALFSSARHTELFRITAIAHNEIPHYRSCLSRLRSERGQPI